MRDALDWWTDEVGRDDAIDAATSRALDADATRVLGIPSALLMENAARGAARAVKDRLGSGTALILCGAGNNGGDGLALARLLAPHACVALIARPDAARCPDAALQFDVLQRAGIHVVDAPSVEDLDALAEGASVLVDALLGTGLADAPRGLFAEWIRWLLGRSESSAHSVVALDLPSGLEADRGQAFDPCVLADETVTFARPKLGLFVGDGPRVSGRVRVATIGLPEPWVEQWLARRQA